MGGLLSRAFKRLTQGSSSSAHSQSSTHNDESREQYDRRDAEVEDTYHIANNGKSLAESIPVGQSIDSAEYTALRISNNKDKRHHDSKDGVAKKSDTDTKLRDSELVYEEKKQAITSDKEGAACKGPGVEEAVIKIQALVRGHLTRKALKDSHHHSVPPPNALGQFQFDEESLIKNPLNAVFLSPTLSLDDKVKQQQSIMTHIAEQTPFRTPLDSNAEFIETATAAATPPNSTTITTTTTREAVPETQVAGTQVVQEQRTNEERRKLAKLNTRSSTSPSKLETPPQPGFSLSSDSCSPVPSEANASIDLNTCGSPTSASIDILDHNIKPNDRIASILHPIVSDEKKPRNEEPLCQQQLPGVREDLVVDHIEREQQGFYSRSSAEFPENEEVAAIRIQSAFRGYRTRKNSPYRTRSSTTSSGNERQQDAQFNQQEQSTIHDVNEEFHLQSERGEVDEDLNEAAIEHDLARVAGNLAHDHDENVGTQPRRSSRARQRDYDAVTRKLGSLDECNTTDEADTTTVKESLPMQQHLSCLSDTTIESAEGSVKKSLLTTKTSSADYNSNNNNSMTASLSIDKADLTESNVSELETTEAAITSAESVTSTPCAVFDATQPAREARSSFAGQVEAVSLETLDTDSSFLGAALSLNDDEPLNEEIAQTNAANSDQSTNTVGLIQHLAIDEDKSSITNEPKSGTRKLFDDMTRGLTKAEDDGADQGGVLVEEVAVLDGQAVVEEEAQDDQQLKQDNIQAEERMATVPHRGGNKVWASVTLSEEEQRAIELESDEIERRDPRGQVSEERAKSPQIITEQPQFGRVSVGSVLDASTRDSLVFGALEKQQLAEQRVVLPANTNDNHAPDTNDNNNNNNNNLTVELLMSQRQEADSPSVSGRSSPALNSSGAPSSSEPEDDEGDDEEDGHQRVRSSPSSGTRHNAQQQSAPNGSGAAPASGLSSRNKKRNNRHKKKSKK